jgi:hypothetical protein
MLKTAMCSKNLMAIRYRCAPKLISYIWKRHCEENKFSIPLIVVKELCDYVGIERVSDDELQRLFYCPSPRETVISSQGVSIFLKAFERITSDDDKAASLSIISTMINPNARWKRGSLLRAYAHLTSFESMLGDAPLPPPHFLPKKPFAQKMLSFITHNDDNYFSLRKRLGPKAPGSELNIDSVMLFSAAFFCGITESLRIDDNVFDLAAKVIAACTVALSGENVAFLLPNCKEVDEQEVIASMILLAPIRFWLHSAEGAVCAQPGRLLHPFCDADAIALSAFTIGLDLRRSPYPRIEFAKAMHDKNTHQCRWYTSAPPYTMPSSVRVTEYYTPAMINTRFAKEYAACPYFFDLYATWSDFFSDHLYTSAELERFALVEGFDISKGANGGVIATIDNSPRDEAAVNSSSAAVPSYIAAYASIPLALESLLTTTPGVIFGAHPKATNTISPISFESIEDIICSGGHESVVTFTMVSHVEEEASSRSHLDYASISLDDLILSLRHSKSFSVDLIIGDGNTEKNVTHRLSTRTVEKLKRLILASPSKKRTHGESIQSVIREVMGHTIRRSEHVEELRCLSLETPGMKNAVTNAFYKLLYAGLYMRGWKVVAASNGDNNAFPLRASETGSTPDQFLDIEMNVTTALNDFDDAVGSIESPNVRRLIRSATLLRATTQIGGGDKLIFRPVTNLEQGFTIEDRISIVREGSGTDNIYSCLRMSSNLLVSSAWYYLLTVVGSDPGFDISDLDEIM